MKLFLLFFLTLCLSGCASMEKTEQTGNFGYERNENFIISEADLEVAVNNPKEIVLDKEQQVYIIDSAGDYFLKGECEGQIQIDVQDQVVHLILEDVKMQSKNGPAIYVKSAAKVVITIPEKTSSVIMDSTNYRGYEDARACIYGEDDITINGEGRLQVYGYCKDAIRTKDVLKIINGSLEVSSKGDGLRGNDGVMIQEVDLYIQCEGTGIYTEKKNKEKRGYVDIFGGIINIIAGEYGIDAAQNVYIQQCIGEIYGTVKDINCFGEQFIEEGCIE